MASKKTTPLKEVSGKKYPPMVVKGIVKWCKVFTPDEMSGKYNLNVYLDETSIKQIADLGIPIRSDEDGSFISPFAYSKDIDGNPVTFDNIFTAGMKKWEHGKLIGNGSYCAVEFYPKDWDFKGKTGTHARLMNLQVLKHVAYGGSSLKAESEYFDAADETSPFAVAG